MAKKPTISGSGTSCGASLPSAVATAPAADGVGDVASRDSCGDTSCSGIRGRGEAAAAPAVVVVVVTGPLKLRVCCCRCSGNGKTVGVAAVGGMVELRCGFVVVPVAVAEGGCVGAVERPSTVELNLSEVVVVVLRQTLWPLCEEGSTPALATRGEACEGTKAGPSMDSAAMPLDATGWKRTAKDRVGVLISDCSCCFCRVPPLTELKCGVLCSSVSSSRRLRSAPGDRSSGVVDVPAPAVADVVPDGSAGCTEAERLACIDGGCVEARVRSKDVEFSVVEVSPRSPRTYTDELPTSAAPLLCSSRTGPLLLLTVLSLSWLLLPPVVPPPPSSPAVLYAGGGSSSGGGGAASDTATREGGATAAGAASLGKPVGVGVLRTASAARHASGDDEAAGGFSLLCGVPPLVEGEVTGGGCCGGEDGHHSTEGLRGVTADACEPVTSVAPPRCSHVPGTSASCLRPSLISSPSPPKLLPCAC
jgi:hypothetical protein